MRFSHENTFTFPIHKNVEIETGFEDGEDDDVIVGGRVRRKGECKVEEARSGSSVLPQDWKMKRIHQVVIVWRRMTSEMESNFCESLMRD